MYGHMYGSIWFIIVKEYGGKLELKGQKSQILMESLEYSATLTSDSHCGWRKVTTPSHHVATFPASQSPTTHVATFPACVKKITSVSRLRRWTKTSASEANDSNSVWPPPTCMHWDRIPFVRRASRHIPEYVYIYLVFEKKEASETGMRANLTRFIWSYIQLLHLSTRVEHVSRECMP